MCRWGVEEAWTDRGMDEAVKLILSEDNTLYGSLTAKINNYTELRAALRSVFMTGERLPYNIHHTDIAQLQMYGFIRNENNEVKIANRIFETLLYNLFCLTKK